LCIRTIDVARSSGKSQIMRSFQKRRKQRDRERSFQRRDYRVLFGMSIPSGIESETLPTFLLLLMLIWIFFNLIFSSTFFTL
jgi:hypothetical protein